MAAPVVPASWMEIITPQELQEEHSFVDSLRKYKALSQDDKADPQNLRLLNTALPSHAQRVEFPSELKEAAGGLTLTRRIHDAMAKQKQNLEQTKVDVEESREAFRGLRKPTQEDKDLQDKFRSATHKMSDKNSLVVEACNEETSSAAIFAKHCPGETITGVEAQAAKLQEVKNRVVKERNDTGLAQCELLVQAMGSSKLTDLSKTWDSMAATTRTFHAEKECAQKQRLKSQENLVAKADDLRRLETHVKNAQTSLENSLMAVQKKKENAKEQFRLFREAMMEHNLADRQASYQQGLLSGLTLQQRRWTEEHTKLVACHTQVEEQTAAIAETAVTYATQAQSANDQALRDVTNHCESSFKKVFEVAGFVRGTLGLNRDYSETAKSSAEALKMEAEDVQKQETDRNRRQVHQSEINVHKDSIKLHTDQLAKIARIERSLEAELNAYEEVLRSNADVKQKCSKAFESARESASAYFNTSEEISSAPIPRETQERQQAKEKATSEGQSYALVVREVKEEMVQLLQQQNQEVLKVARDRISDSERRKRIAEEETTAAKEEAAAAKEKEMETAKKNEELERMVEAYRKENDAMRANAQWTS